MKLICIFFSFIFACPEKWVEDETSGVCSPAGAFELVCNSDGTASLTLELEHFYSNLPDDPTDLESALQLTDGWSRRFNSFLGLYKKTTSLTFSQTSAESLTGSYTIAASDLGIKTTTIDDISIEIHDAGILSYNIECFYDSSISIEIGAIEISDEVDPVDGGGDSTELEFTATLQKVDEFGNAADATFWTIGDTVQIEINQPAGLTGVLVSLESCLSYSDDAYSADENYITHSTCVNDHISARIEDNAVRFDAFMYQNAATNNTFLECNIQVCVSSDGENADLADCANLITANADSALLNAAANNLTCQ